MKRLVSIGEASLALGVSITTLRRWEADGKLPAAVHTAGGHRRYDLAKLRPEMFYAPNNPVRRTMAYVSVPSSDFKEELERQKRTLELYCAGHGWTFEVVTDIGLEMDCREQGFQHLLRAVTAGEVERLILIRTERLPRLGMDLLFAVCTAKNVEIVVLNRESTGTAVPERRRKPWPAVDVSQPMPLEPEIPAPATGTDPILPDTTVRWG